MADSDGEYVDRMSDDGNDDEHMTLERGEDRQPVGGVRGRLAQSVQNRVQAQTGGTRSGRHAARAAGAAKKKANQRNEKQAAWETVKRSWDTVGEAEDGQVLGVEFLEAAEKRRRVLRDTTPLQRGIIRHMVLVVDMSFAMASRDYLPSCHRVALATAADFVRAYFEQNPISQLAILAMRDGICLRVSDMGGNPSEHLEKLRAWDAVEPQGHPSLQNALEMCRGALFHTPSHGTREVLVVFGALLSSDPGDIHDTIGALLADRVRVSIVGLAAQVAVCADICARTNGGDTRSYRVALHDVHFRELVLAATTPPATQSAAKHVDANEASLLKMGFPSRATTADGGVSLCACHNRPVHEGYACTRCRTKVCRLPAECPACGLTLILSTHLARSYHHLFPLRNWAEVPWAAAAAAVREKGQLACRACLVPFPDLPPDDSRLASTDTAENAKPKAKTRTKTMEPDAAAPAKKELKGVSESGRYACTVCGSHFCIDCDVFAHEVIHNCAGCQSDTRAAADQAADQAACAADVARVSAASKRTAAAALAAAAGAATPSSDATAPRPKTKITLKRSAPDAMAVD